MAAPLSTKGPRRVLVVGRRVWTATRSVGTFSSMALPCAGLPGWISVDALLESSSTNLPMCYKRLPGMATWLACDNLCQAEGGRQACVSSMDENEGVAAFINPYTCQPQAGLYEGCGWIGLHRDHRVQAELAMGMQLSAAQDGDWEWSGGCTSSFRNWESGEPDGVGSDDAIRWSRQPSPHASCTIIRSTGQWRDVDCRLLSKCVCETPRPSPPPSAPSPPSLPPPPPPSPPPTWIESSWRSIVFALFALVPAISVALAIDRACRRRRQQRAIVASDGLRLQEAELHAAIQALPTVVYAPAAAAQRGEEHAGQGAAEACSAPAGESVAAMPTPATTEIIEESANATHIMTNECAIWCVCLRVRLHRRIMRLCECVRACVSLSLPESATTQSCSPSLSRSLSLGIFEAGDELRLLPCRHAFHRGCIDEWLLGKRGRQPGDERAGILVAACPLCKAVPIAEVHGQTSGCADASTSGSPGLAA